METSRRHCEEPLRRRDPALSWWLLDGFGGARNDGEGRQPKPNFTGSDVIMKRPICDMLGIEFPLLAFSHCRDVVAAVSRAGGFGVLGATTHTPETIEQELKWIDDHVDGKPYGLDVLIPENISTAGEKDVTWKRLEARISNEHRDFTRNLLK